MDWVKSWQGPFNVESGLWKSWLLEAKAGSVSPVSRFQVGAVAVGQSGKAYLGTNLEFKGLPIGQTVHAEQWAISQARNHGETALEALLVSEMPCGHCRQFLQELGQPDLPVYVLQDEAWTQKVLSALLPEPFTLANRNTGLLVSSKAWLEHPLSATDPLVKLALQHAQSSYSPYTQSFCAVAIEARTGETFASGLVESAAYNPSLPALQGALIALLSSGKVYSDIQRIVLLEREGASLSWASEVSHWLSQVAPQAEFFHVVATLRLL